MLRTAIRHVIPTLAVTALVALPGARAAHAQTFGPCPQSCIDSANPQCSTTAVRSGSFGPSHGSGIGAGNYDLPNGHAHSDGQASGGFGGGNRTICEDDFQVTGPPNGTGVDFVVHLFLSMSLSASAGGGCGSGSGELGVGGTLVTSPTFVGGQFGSTVGYTIDVPTHQVVGTAFRVHYLAQAGTCAVGVAHTDATLQITGLPPGTSLVSCQGFHFDSPVPALNVSWGRFRSMYR